MTAAAARSCVCLALAALVGCGPDATAWGPLGAAGRSITGAPVPFGAGGLTPPLAVPPSSGESVALFARSEPGTCFALASLEDALGHAWVTRRSAGPYCADCAIRTSLAQEEALFVLPRAGAFAPGDGFAVRLGLMDCHTLTPLTRAGEAPGLELAWSARPTTPDSGHLSVRFVVSAHSMLFGRPDLQRALLEHLNDELEGAALEVSLDDVAELADVPREARFSTTELDELAAILERAPPAAHATVDAVFAGCLRYDDPFFGPPVPVDGFTPRVGGGAGPASAVFMPGLRCDGFSGAPASYRLDAYAHVLAHELGHFLGLYHTVETDGTTDLLSDTDESNTMHHNPSLAAARGFSPTQGRHLRSHPWVRPSASPRP